MSKKDPTSAPTGLVGLGLIKGWAPSLQVSFQQCLEKPAHARPMGSFEKDVPALKFLFSVYLVPI